MNFQDLYRKIAALEEGDMGIMAAPSQPVVGEELEAELEECGDMMPMANKPDAEQDHVSVSVNMNGSGTGGIRDLMNILRNIDDVAGDDDSAAIIDIEPMGHSEPHNPMAHDTASEPMFGDLDVEEEFNPADTFQANTTPEPEYAGLGAVIPTGNDLASKGIERPKVNGGGNPMQEALIQELTNRYNEIREQEVTEAAKWRDPKYKDKFYNPKPDDYPGAKHKIGGSEYDHNDPLRKGYGRHGTGSLNTHGKRKGMPSRDHITSLKGSIKDAHGKHPKPNLPE
jgi:hypothetical protein